LENRVGEPAANPYLYMVSQILSGLDGIDRRLEPPDPVDAPYETEAEPLPRSLMEALQALDDSTMFRAVLGDRFIDYILTLKQAEVSRFLATVTDWEHREYFEIF
jgi:glutamine synthetase